MRVLSIVSTKGGVGKTTLTSALAVRAAKESQRVAMVDLDPQGSLAAWWKRRGGSGNPKILADADTAIDAIKALERDGCEWVFIDTPPAFFNTLTDAIQNADLAIVPLRPSALDLIGGEDAVLLAQEKGTPYMCVIADAEPKWKTTHSARDYLLAANLPVAETVIAHRAPYLAAMSSGRTGPEVERDDKCAAEVDGLWNEIKEALAKSERLRRV
jgi:chromosome partitioning protein